MILHITIGTEHATQPGGGASARGVNVTEEGNLTFRNCSTKTRGGGRQTNSSEFVWNKLVLKVKGPLKHLH